METLHCENCGENVENESGVTHSCACTTYEKPKELVFLPDEVESWDYISYDG